MLQPHKVAEHHHLFGRLWISQFWQLRLQIKLKNIQKLEPNSDPFDSDLLFYTYNSSRDVYIFKLEKLPLSWPMYSLAEGENMVSEPREEYFLFQCNYTETPVTESCRLIHPDPVSDLVLENCK